LQQKLPNHNANVEQPLVLEKPVLQLRQIIFTAVVKQESRKAEG
jgi:hypothetical protein